ncbi:hypothetical protein GCM10010923_02450 [Blastomonas marina]|uniref:Uncharacterized protein n=1 Tax=Blastomonas marina TaxID=1867408 RepID=A0ABQ1F3I9_9SPHN|nr:hypothetical protein [Blastomonas marina]GFZ97894.1 hypothetical protein GCM10010923_02450 [Blastomonas marina]
MISRFTAGLAAAATLVAPPAAAQEASWYSGSDPSEEAFVQQPGKAYLLIAGCDALDGIYPYLAFGIMSFVNWRIKEQTLGFRDEPNEGVELTVSGTTSDGPFTFRTSDRGYYGGTAARRDNGAGDEVVVNYAGGSITPAQLRLLMRARTITVSVLGFEYDFSAAGSARTLGRLSCTADL